MSDFNNDFYYRNGEMIEHTEEEKKELFLEKIKQANFPPRAYNFIKNKEYDKEKVLPVVKDYVKTKKQCGLCIVGDVGIGKTVSIILLLNYLLANKNKYTMCVFPQYVKYNELYILYKLYERGFHIEHKDNKEKLYLDYREDTRLLFIDDIVGGWDMFDLINYRYDNNLTTFLSSNLDFKEFKKNMGLASMRRIKADMVVNFSEGGNE